MKVYVDKLPINCDNCPFAGNQYCHYQWDRYTDTEKPFVNVCDLKYYDKVCCEFNNPKEYKEYLDKIPKNNEQQYETCPLQPLSDYTKKVRKEVCEEIRKEIFEYLKVNSMEELENLSLLDSTLTYDVITDKLNQIQGE